MCCCLQLRHCKDPVDDDGPIHMDVPKMRVAKVAAAPPLWMARIMRNSTACSRPCVGSQEQKTCLLRPVPHGPCACVAMRGLTEG